MRFIVLVLFLFSTATAHAYVGPGLGLGVIGTILGALLAGLVLGARVPIVLTSRADSLTARLASVALAMLAAPDRRDGEADRPEVDATANAAVPDAALRSDPAVTGSAA